MKNQWTRVLASEELPAGQARTVKPAGHQVAVFRTEDDEVHAVDNRCPHEGYPLADGVVKDGMLTCEWHNWKFRLCDGACVLGGEDVRRYPVRVDAEGIWIDLAPLPKTDVIPALEASVSKAIDEEDWGQMSRAVQRMLVAGQTPQQVLGFAADWTAHRAVYGFDHGLAAAADLALAFASFAGDDVDLPLLQAVTLLAEPHVRWPARDWPEPEPPAPGADVEAELRRRIESEQREAAEALLRGAIEAGAAPDDVFRWLTHAATDHFLDFGHAHIYVVKAEELLEHIGWQHAHPVLTSLVSRIVYGTREDRLPYMRKYARAMAAYADSFGRWARVAPVANADVVREEFFAAVLDGSLEEALGAVAAALDARVPAERIAGLLGVAAARRLLRFNAELEADDAGNEGWLTVTHSLTHADAVRESLVRRAPTPDSLRGLFQSARFIQHLQPLDGPAPGPYRSAVLDGDELVRAAVGDRASRPIFVCHHVKTSFAAQRLADATGARDPLVANARFLAAALQERRVLRRAKIARELVRRGKMHRKLLGY